MRAIAAAIVIVAGAMTIIAGVIASAIRPEATEAAFNLASVCGAAIAVFGAWMAWTDLHGTRLP